METHQETQWWKCLYLRRYSPKWGPYLVNSVSLHWSPDCSRLPWGGGESSPDSHSGQGGCSHAGEGAGAGGGSASRLGRELCLPQSSLPPSLLPPSTHILGSPGPTSSPASTAPHLTCTIHHLSSTLLKNYKFFLVLSPSDRRAPISTDSDSSYTPFWLVVKLEVCTGGAAQKDL